MYGSLEEAEDRRKTHHFGVHWAIPVAAVALLALLAVVVSHHESTAPDVLVSGDSDVLKQEKQGIAVTQANLARLTRKVNAEAAILHKSKLGSKKEALLAAASKAKAKASREVAKALLATVQQHTAEMAKQKDLGERDKEESLYRAEHAKAEALAKSANAAHMEEEAANKEAKDATMRAVKAKQQLKIVENEINTDEAKISTENLEAENAKALAKTTQHLADLGLASAAARKQNLEELKNKIRRLDRRIKQLKRKYKADEADESEDTKAAQQYRRETNDARADKRRLHKEQHDLKIKQADQDRDADELARKLEDAKEKVHRRDNTLERAKSKEHEASTALHRAKDRLRDAEHRIYQAQLKNQADRHPSDADLGLV